MNSHIAVFVQRMPQSDAMAVTLTSIATAVGSKSPDNLLLIDKVINHIIAKFNNKYLLL